MKFFLRRDAPALAIVAFMFVASAAVWSRVPARMAVHWGIEGEPDRWGGRVEGLLAMPAIAGLVWALMGVLPRIDPGRANYASFAGVYSAIRTAIVAFLALLHGVLIASALGLDVDVGSIVGPATGLLFVLLGGVLGKIRPNWFVGIRTPWTLSSKLSWTRTHRVGGWAFIGLGVAVIAAGAVSPKVMFVTLMAGILGVVILTFAYSYVVWRGDPDRQTPGGTTPAPPSEAP